MGDHLLIFISFAASSSWLRTISWISTSLGSHRSSGLHLPNGFPTGHSALRFWASISSWLWLTQAFTGVHVLDGFTFRSYYMGYMSLLAYAVRLLVTHRAGGLATYTSMGFKYF
jgi:hypothetical protein